MGSDSRHFAVTILLAAVPTGLFLFETLYRTTDYREPFGEDRWYVGGTAATLYLIAMVHLFTAALMDPGGEQLMPHEPKFFAHRFCLCYCRDNSAQLCPIPAQYPRCFGTKILRYTKRLAKFLTYLTYPTISRTFHRNVPFIPSSTIEALQV
jgi:hypothetical protein